jgi:hypothetical protein
MEYIFQFKVPASAVPDEESLFVEWMGLKISSIQDRVVRELRTAGIVAEPSGLGLEDDAESIGRQKIITIFFNCERQKHWQSRGAIIDDDLKLKPQIQQFPNRKKE